jgi:hypothetical protein
MDINFEGNLLKMDFLHHHYPLDILLYSFSLLWLCLFQTAIYNFNPKLPRLLDLLVPTYTPSTKNQGKNNPKNNTKENV